MGFLIFPKDPQGHRKHQLLRLMGTPARNPSIPLKTLSETYLSLCLPSCSFRGQECPDGVPGGSYGPTWSQGTLVAKGSHPRNAPKPVLTPLGVVEAGDSFWVYYLYRTIHLFIFNNSKSNNKYKENSADDLYLYIKAKNRRQDLLFS